MVEVGWMEERWVRGRYIVGWRGGRGWGWRGNRGRVGWRGGRGTWGGWRG